MSFSSFRLPCVIYCHGNCGCRIDALNAIQLLLPLNITVFSFDFTGCGLSDGKYVSLGYFEKEDVKAIVQYLRSKDTVSRIGLWGRSMGAATSLIQCARDGSLSGVVADSPFTSLEDIIVDLVQSYKSWIPKTAIKGIISLSLSPSLFFFFFCIYIKGQYFNFLSLFVVATEAIRKSIQNRANFDILKLRPMDYVKNSLAPALFSHAENDNFIKLKHSQTLFELYAGDKNIITFDGDHNSQRPDFYYDAVATFFYNCLISNDKELDKEKYRPVRGLLSWKHNVGLLTKKGRALMESLDHSVDDSHCSIRTESGQTSEIKLKNKLSIDNSSDKATITASGNKVLTTNVVDINENFDDFGDHAIGSMIADSRKEFLYNEERISEEEMMQIKLATIESIKE